MIKNADWKLCYVEDHLAWFSPYEPQQITGDDWNDAPYEHNASEPYHAYVDDKYIDPDFYIIAYRGPYSTPEEHSWTGNSQYSVDDINSGMVAWLSTHRYCSMPHTPIYAGCTLAEFINILRANDGTIFLPYEGE